MRRFRVDPGFDCEMHRSVGQHRTLFGSTWASRSLCAATSKHCAAAPVAGLLSYEQQVALHRWLGYSVVASVTVHLAGFWIQWFGQGMETFLIAHFPPVTQEGSAAASVRDWQVLWHLWWRQNGRIGPCGLHHQRLLPLEFPRWFIRGSGAINWPERVFLPVGDVPRLWAGRELDTAHYAG